jgi:hypothetical protein
VADKYSVTSKVSTDHDSHSSTSSSLTTTFQMHASVVNGPIRTPTKDWVIGTVQAGKYAAQAAAACQINI